MKKELQVLGSFNNDGVFEPTHFCVTKEMANHENNGHLSLLEKSFVRIGGCTEEQPSDTPSGYYICSGNNWVFVPFT